MAEPILTTGGEAVSLVAHAASGKQDLSLHFVELKSGGVVNYAEV